MRRLIASVLGAVLGACAVTASAAPPSPPTVPGWPRAEAAGHVVEGPGNGPLVASSSGFDVTVSAYRRDGGLLWRVRRAPGCGNCDDGPQRETLWPDGTWGPFGWEGDDSWFLDASGRELPGCAGLVLADGTCISAGYDLSVRGYTQRPEFRFGRMWAPREAVPGPAGWQTLVEGDEPPMIVRDGAGLVYAALSPAIAPSGAPAPGLLMAMDPVTRTVVWSLAGPTQVLAGLPSGVVVAADGGVGVVGADGAWRWHRRIPTYGARITPGATAADPARGRLYVGREGGGRRLVTALDLADGVVVWETPASLRARLLSVGRGGRIYLSIGRPRQLAVRAVRFRDARTVWERRTPAPVMSARELRNGTVAVSFGFGFRPREDRLTLLDPR